MDVNKNRPVQFDSLHRTVLLSESEEKCRYKSEGYVYKAVGLEGRFLGIYSVKLERGGIFNLARVTDEEYYPGIVREIIGVGDPVNPGVKGIHTRDRPESRHQLFQLGNNVIRIDAARQNEQLTVSFRICLLNGFIEIITEVELFEVVFSGNKLRGGSGDLVHRGFDGGIKSLVFLGGELGGGEEGMNPPFHHRYPLSGGRGVEDAAAAAASQQGEGQHAGQQGREQTLEHLHKRDLPLVDEKYD